MQNFRVLSFDRPLTRSDLRHAKIVTVVVGGVVISALATAVWALMDTSSDRAANVVKANPVRVLGGTGESGKPCDQQTWPYLETHCLKPADPKTAARTTPKHGLGAQQVALPNGTKSNTPDAPVETTGSAPAADENEPTNSIAASVAPAAPGAAITPGHALGTDAARQRHDSGSEPRLSRREQRRMQREERMRLRMQQREAERQTRATRQRARTERTDSSPSGGTRRVIVIRRGSPNDEFFRNIR